MDITGSMNTMRTLGSTNTLRKWAVRGAFVGVAAFVVWDLVMKYLEGPTIQFFFPRLYVWLFLGFMGFLVWTTIKALGQWRWRLAFGLVVALGAIFTMRGTSDSFPFLAPGQEITVEGRASQVKPISVGVFGLEVRPGALDNWIDARVDWMVEEWRSYFQTAKNALLKMLGPPGEGITRNALVAIHRVGDANRMEGKRVQNRADRFRRPYIYRAVRPMGQCHAHHGCSGHCHRHVGSGVHPRWASLWPRATDFRAR